MTELRYDVSQSITSKQSYQKQHYDKTHASLTKFGVGKHVLTFRPKGSNDVQSRKTEPRYKGPFPITKALNKDRYEVDELPGSTKLRKAYTGMCPSERLKLFLGKGVAQAVNDYFVLYM